MVVDDPLAGDGAQYGAFTEARLARRAKDAGLYFPPTVLGPLVAALRAEKHIVLIGPPGTGKTSLATLIADVGREAMLCSGCLATTATSDWTIQDTVGGAFESGAGPTFRPGVLLEAIQTGRWLMIDEINRANMDRALGEFFTVLSGQAVVLPFKSSGFGKLISIVPVGAEVPPQTEPIRVPRAWRIIATMNEYDRGLLFRMSHALMRRFAFIRVSSPGDDVFDSLITGPGAIVRDMLPLRQLKDMGPAIYMDAADYAAQRLQDGIEQSQVLFEVLTAFFLPQFDNMDALRSAQLIGLLGNALEARHIDEVRAMLRELGAEPAI